MELVIFGLTIFMLIGLIAENYCAIYRRKKLKAVIYVNGTRGKSTVTRMIYAALQSGGIDVACKTTGTVPMFLDCTGKEIFIKRRGTSNIKEQLWTLKQAVNCNAQVLVCECMAITPHLQKTSQEKMLRSNIGVITNVRLDHLEEMGETLEEIAQSLSNTIPKNGFLFTAEKQVLSILQNNCQKNNTQCVACDGQDPSLPSFNFKDNVDLALQVAQHLGVTKEKALKGILDYPKDPFDLAVYRLPQEKIFINGMSINDPCSTLNVYQSLQKKYTIQNNQMVLIINNRSDRGYRIKQMVQVAEKLNPHSVILIGDSRFIADKLLKKHCPHLVYKKIRHVQEIDFKNPDITTYFAIGNIAKEGKILTEHIQREGEKVE